MLDRNKPYFTRFRSSRGSIRKKSFAETLYRNQGSLLTRPYVIWLFPPSVFLISIMTQVCKLRVIIIEGFRSSMEAHPAAERRLEITIYDI